MSPYPHLFSEWKIRNTTIANRVVFAPTCPTWVDDPLEGVFTDQAVAYYEERAQGRLRADHHRRHIIQQRRSTGTVAFPGLWNDEQVEGLRRSSTRCTRHGCSSRPAPARRACARRPVLKKDRAYDLDATWYARRAEPGAARRVPVRADAEGARGARDRGDARGLRRRPAARDRGRRRRRRRVPPRPRLPAVAVPVAALQPPHRPLGRLRTRTGCASRSRRCGGCAQAIGDERLPRLPHQLDVVLARRPGDSRTSSASSATLERETDIDYVNVSAGVHHSFIHTPMTYEGGWERGYTMAVKRGLVEARAARRAHHAARGRRGASSRRARRTRSCSRASCFADAEWAEEGARGPAGGHPPLRRRELLLAPASIRGRRVQCVYNPRSAASASGAPARSRRRPSRSGSLVVGAGPGRPRVRAHRGGARARRASSSSATREVGGHVRAWQSLLPGRTEYGQHRHLARRAGRGQRRDAAARRGGDARSTACWRQERPDHVVIATGSRYRPRRLAGPDGVSRCAGWETGNCVAWDAVANGEVVAGGRASLVRRRPAGRRRPADRRQLLKERGCDVTRRHPLADGRHGDDPRGLLPVAAPAAVRRRRARHARPLRRRRSRHAGRAAQRLRAGADDDARRRLDRDEHRPPVGERPLPRRCASGARASR